MSLVISPKAYNSKVGSGLVCPATSHVMGYQIEVGC
jgi:hypothetical protein